MLVVVVGVVLAAVALAVVLVVVLGAALVVALAGALLDVLVAVVLVVVLAGALLVVFAAAVVELVLPVLVVELPHAVKRIAPSSKTPIHQRRPVVLNQITNCPPLRVRPEVSPGGSVLLLQSASIVPSQYKAIIKSTR